MLGNNIRIGSRVSRLALSQAWEFATTLRSYYPEMNVEILGLSSIGDEISGPLRFHGGKALFTSFLDSALLKGEIDIAVHSAKDLPAFLEPGIKEMAGVLPRKDPRDAFVSPSFSSIEQLPFGATVGTSSLRRSTQILRIRPDLRILPIRGNISSRIAKMEIGGFDALIMSVAGFDRLSLSELISLRLSTEYFVPAVCQGVVAANCRTESKSLIRMLQNISCQKTAICVDLERSFVKAFNGSCFSTIGILVEMDDNSNIRSLAAAFAGDKELRRVFSTKDFDKAKKELVDFGIELKKDGRFDIRDYE